MKLVLSVLAAFLPLSAAAMTASDASLSRVLDGNAYRCTETYEGGRTAYVPEIRSLAVNETGRVAIELDLSFQLCVRNGNELHWAPRSPLDPIYSRDSDGAEVRVEFRNPELVLGNAGYSAQQVAPLTNEARERVSYEFLPREFLSGKEFADLESGKPVPVRLSLLYRAIGTAYTARGETPLGYQFGGTYTLFFTLQK